jgi:hypothetical protein
VSQNVRVGAVYRNSLVQGVSERLGEKKKYKAHISKYVRHILKYLGHIFGAVKQGVKNACGVCLFSLSTFCSPATRLCAAAEKSL